MVPGPEQKTLLRITEIFHSIQGESKTIGHPTVFVRLTGCPMRCVYCDTAYAFDGGEKREVAAILADVAAYEPGYVTVTGGEPLAQPECRQLLKQLCDAGYQTSLETGGGVDIADVDERVCIVMDLKAPASGEESSNRLENLDYLKASDQVKFVLSDDNDYRWARDMIVKHSLSRFEILMSPVWERLEPAHLADWILRDRLPVRLQLQLHKVLWGDVAGR